jgi:hypothetical protein
MSGPAPNRFVAGLDLGRQVDPSALALLQWHRPPPGRTVYGELVEPLRRPPVYECPALVRWPLGTPYRRIAEQVSRFFKAPPLSEHCPVLVVDATGVGDAVFEMLREQMTADAVRGGIVGVWITAGSAVTQDTRGHGRWRVAKRQLASVLQVLLGNRRLLVAESLPEARTLKHELGQFTVKISDSLNESFEAWRENEHDDLVLATALAAWAAERWG